MKAGYILLGVILVHGLSSCNGGSSSFSPDAINTDPQPYNLAASRFGAQASSDADSENTANINDQDDTTFWRSEPDIPILIELENVEKIIEFRLEGEDFPSTISTNPDILIEFSEDGKTYQASAITTIFTGPPLPCAGTSRNESILVCAMDPPEPMKFIRITSQNGKSFIFSELAAVALK